MTYKISKAFKTVHKRNPISGHSWSENAELKTWLVSGGKWGTTRHRSIESAEREIEVRESIDKMIEEIKNA